MSIAATSQDSHNLAPLDVDLALLARDIDDLHVVARRSPVDAARFARLERSVSFRLDVLAHVLASQDTIVKV